MDRVANQAFNFNGLQRFARRPGRVRAPSPAVLAASLFLLLSLIRYGPVALVAGSRWHMWFDQSCYYTSTIAFAHGDLAAARHWYPLVYALLSVPALLILPYNPYLLVDALCVGVTAACVVRVADLFGIGRWVALLAFLATTFLHPQLQNAWLEPWTSTLSSALIWMLIARTGAVFVAPAGLAPRPAMVLGMLGVLIALTRPADAVIALVIGAGLAAYLGWRGALSRRVVGAALAGAVIPLVGYAALHCAIYGWRTTDYMRRSAEIGLSFSDIGWKASVLFVDPHPWFPGGAGVLRLMPWLPVGLAGCIVAPLRGPRALGLFAALLAVTVGAYTLVLTAYVDLLPAGLWQFGNIHYFKWIFPLLGLLGWRFVRDLRQAPKAHLAVLGAILAVTGLRYDAVPAGPHDAARRIDFRAPRPLQPKTDAWAQVYFAGSVVRDGARLHHNVLDYRQVPDGVIVRAVALRGDFSGPAAWYGAGVPGSPLPARDAVAGVWPARPVMRWKPRLRWGAPCWIVSCPDRR